MKKDGHNVCKLLMVIISVLISFNSSMVFSDDTVPIDLSSGNVTVISSETIRVDNVRIPGIEGTYWAIFRWNGYTLGFDIIDAGVGGDDISGSWSGTGYSTWYSYSGGISASLSQAGSRLSGNFTVTNTDFGTVTIALSGTVTGTMVDLSGEWSSRGYSGFVNISGSFSGNTMEGSYDFYVYGEGLYDRGEFVINR